jgi:hypothetical protein
MDSIKDIIPHVIAPLSKGQSTHSDIAGEWQRLCGEGKTSSVQDLKEGVLTVHVDCSARLVKMNLNKARYLEELSGKHPQIKSIRFKVGKI